MEPGERGVGGVGAFTPVPVRLRHLLGELVESFVMHSDADWEFAAEGVKVRLMVRGLPFVTETGVAMAAPIANPALAGLIWAART